MFCQFAGGAARFESVPLDNLFIAQYMPFANEVQIKVYLYGLMQCYYPGIQADNMEQALGLTDEQIKEAFLFWQGRNLVQIVQEDPLRVEYRSMRQSALMADAPALPGKYHALVQAVQGLLAPRHLSAAELKRVYDWVEVFGLEEAAVLALVSHCVEVKGKRAGIKYMDTVARAWADEDIRTAEQANERIHRYKEQLSGAQAVLKRWRLSRKATQDELDLYQKWESGWGFTREAVLEACVALTKAERPSFLYLNAVLESLYQAQVKEPAAIRAYFEQQDEHASLARMVFDRAGIYRAAKPNERSQLAMFVQQWNMPVELLLLAADQARDAKEPYGAMKKLLCDWHDNGVQTVSAAQKAMEEQKKSPKEKASQPRALHYMQKMYTDEELAHLTLDLNDDF